MDETVEVRIDGDELVVERTFERCGCRPEVRHMAGGPLGEYRCDCGNELLVGPAAWASISEATGAVTGRTSFVTPGGETVQVAWLTNLE